MNVVFRVDASIEMGIGHVMRCLTLADALRDEGAHCHFVCREHLGNLIDQIASRGHQVYSLPLCQVGQHPDNIQIGKFRPSHFHWLGCDWLTDARQTTDCIGLLNIDWLIVDHYALDDCWEKYLRTICSKIMVIDDLADRNHDCDLLLDQTFGRSNQDYKQQVPAACTIVTGAKYALLRPEFAALRSYSLKRRKEPRLGQLLISMGGIDKENATSKVLQALKGSPLHKDCQIIVVMGENAPWLENIRFHAKELLWKVEVKVKVANMAQLMADSDLAIGAAGSTSWERCCLGLPTLMIVLADNQEVIASALHKGDAALNIGAVSDPYLLNNLKNIFDDFFSNRKMLNNMSASAYAVTAGQGTSLIVDRLLEKA